MKEWEWQKSQKAKKWHPKQKDWEVPASLKRKSETQRGSTDALKEEPKEQPKDWGQSNWQFKVQKSKHEENQSSKKSKHEDDPSGKDDWRGGKTS